MFFHNPSSNYVLLVDVGSGSVGLAICATTGSKDLIWLHREQVPLRVTQAIADSRRAISTAIASSILQFETKGQAALLKHDSSARITNLQATVSAPWSYTVTRCVTLQEDEPFEITDDLLTDLTKASTEQAQESFYASHSLQEQEIVATSQTILDIQASGYRIKEMNLQRATELKITQASTYVQADLVASLQHMQDKLCPQADLEITSFMLANYYTTSALDQVTNDFCLVDVTNEATELGIVRNQTLRYCTHTPFGRTSLAREIAAATGVPLPEAFTSMCNTQTTKKLSADVQHTLEAYQTKLHDLFNETEDKLTIPNQIYLHTDAGLADFFTPIIEAAAQQVYLGSVLVTTPVSVQPNHNPAKKTFVDRSITVGQNFFHTKVQRPTFKYV